MISKEFLVYRETVDGLKPSFISDRGIWLERCSELLESLQSCVGEPQKNCDDLFREWINKGEGGVLLRKGLAQTLQKKLEWQEMDWEFWEKYREEQLAISAARWTQAEDVQQLGEQLNRSKERSKPLYGDLPHCRPLLALPKWDAPTWIRRYNLALLQGFVMQSQVMDWEFPEISLEKLRYLMRYLKFFGLFFKVKQQSDGSVKMRIEGPLQLFAGTKRYQMKMAAAAGVLPQLGDFKLKSKLNYPAGSRPLICSHRDRLKSHYRPFFDYCSDERKLFEDKLKTWLKKSKVQLIEPEISMSALLKERVPDYHMINASAEKLELHIYEQHQLSMLKHWEPSKQESTVKVLMLEKGLEAHVDVPNHVEVMVFNKIPGFAAFKKFGQSIGFF